MALEATDERAATRGGGGERRRTTPTAGAAGTEWQAALSTSWRALVFSRVLIVVVGAMAFSAWGLSGMTDDYDPGSVTHGFGAVGDTLTATFARWDSTWFLAIANDGYGHDAERAAFFPLYPLLVRGGSAFGSPIAAGVLLSLACFFLALVLLHRLTALELDERAADAAVWLLALFPVSFFFSAVYSESLFLLCSVGAVYAARTERWAWAGVAGGCAACTRSAGLVLLLPLALLWWSGRRREDTLSWLWLLLVPAGTAVFPVGLALAGHDAGAPFDAQDTWYRSFAGPYGGIKDGAVAAFEGARQLLSGSRSPVYYTQAGGDPFWVAKMNLTFFAFLVGTVVALVGVFRRLPLAYGAYVLAALALPLSYPVGPQPLMSLSRFVLVLFPLVMWAGWWATRDGRALRRLAVPSALLLVVFTAYFATWRWVA